MGVPYPEQLARKRARLVRATGRFTHLPNPAETLPSAWTMGYRHRLKLPVRGGKRPTVGLYEGPDQRRILDTPDCPVLAPALREALPPLLRWLAGRSGVHSLDLRVSHATGELAAVLACKGGSLPGSPASLLRAVPGLASVAVSTADPARKRVMGARPKVVAGQPAIAEAIGPQRYSLLPGSFFQIDPRQAEVLHHLVRDAVGDAKTVLDLYAGVGAYGRMLAPGRERVVMVEEVRQAAAAARDGAPPNVTVHTARVEDMRFEQRFDVVLLNPARRGSDPASLARVAELAERVVYISCGPETLARDLDVLAAHGMRTLSLQPIDLFPQTPEVETVAVLERGPPLRTWSVPGGRARGPWPDGPSGATGKPTELWALLVGRGDLRGASGVRSRVLAEVAGHRLVALQISGTVRGALDALAKRGLRPAGAEPKTQRFFAERAGLQRPFVHVARDAAGVRAPLHGDLALALEALGAPHGLVRRLGEPPTTEPRRSHRSSPRRRR